MDAYTDTDMQTHGHGNGEMDTNMDMNMDMNMDTIMDTDFRQGHGLNSKHLKPLWSLYRCRKSKITAKNVIHKKLYRKMAY